MKVLLNTLFLLLLRQAIAQDAGTNGTIATYLTNFYFDAVSMTSSNLSVTFKQYGERFLYSINDGTLKNSNYGETLTINIGDKLKLITKGHAIELSKLPKEIEDLGFFVEEFIETLSLNGKASTSNWFMNDQKQLEARVTLKPEALQISPGILTAFVRLPEGYPVRNITLAICDGAPSERMMLNDDQTEMIIKFRRKDIEEVLAQSGASIDTNFVVRGVWRGATTNFFQGMASIKEIVGAKSK